MSPRVLCVLAVLASAPILVASQTPRTSDVQSDLRRVYEWTGDRPVWVDREGRPTADARKALLRLRAVDEDGLAAEDYDAAALEAEADVLEHAASPQPADAAAFDVRLTRSVLTYFRHLHLGRVDPRSLGFHLDHELEPHDFPSLLLSAAHDRSFDAVVAGLRPPFVQYRGLKNALMAYREHEPARARQIELAMERLRWLPDLNGQRLIVVNIPMFHIWGWESNRDDGMPVIDMAAIIGRAGTTRTPVFESRVTAVIVNPEWNVPESIAQNEILPALKRDPNYLNRNHMEMQRDGASVRIRQLPGPWNSLGQIKLMLPNVHDVYLHGTPARELFARARRDFSHGCIRVEDPVALAEWVLAGEEEWTAERLVAAIAAGATRTLTVRQPPRIVVFYMTAAFLPGEGTVQFVEDIYGHDARLDAWLKARSGGTNE
jgi:murein L,D-transpeptidase YcbB/YkuD